MVVAAESGVVGAGKRHEAWVEVGGWVSERECATWAETIEARLSGPRIGIERRYKYTEMGTVRAGRDRGGDSRRETCVGAGEEARGASPC